MNYSIVVAISNKDEGIGYLGKIPWYLSMDIQFFKKLTTTTEDPFKLNAVIMGRNTWDSLPAIYQPLPKRINIVVTSKPIINKQDVICVKSLTEAYSLISKTNQIENVFVIGGESIYKASMDAEMVDTVYLTRVLNYEGSCDKYFPLCNYLDTFVRKKHPFYENEVYQDKNLQFTFELYEKQ